MPRKTQRRKKAELAFYTATIAEQDPKLKHMIQELNRFEAQKRASMPTDETKQESEHRADELNSLKALDLISFNQEAERRFIKLIADYIQEEGPKTVNIVIAEAAFELNISPQTAKRYLQKYSLARRAPFIIRDGQVDIRS